MTNEIYKDLDQRIDKAKLEVAQYKQAVSEGIYSTPLLQRQLEMWEHELGRLLRLKLGAPND